MRRNSGLVAALLVAGCASGSSSVVPVTSLDGRTCAAKLEVGAARPVALDAEKEVTVPFDGKEGCLQSADGAKSAYVVFQLPVSPETYVVSVTSTPLGSTLLSPRLIVLDAAAQTVRERERDAFMFRGASLNLGVRVGPDDRYLVVASDPGSVGKSESHLAANTQATYASTGAGGMFILYTGQEAKRSFTYAHNGSVTVTARPLPK